MLTSAWKILALTYFGLFCPLVNRLLHSWMITCDSFYYYYYGKKISQCQVDKWKWYNYLKGTRSLFCVYMHVQFRSLLFWCMEMLTVWTRANPRRNFVVGFRGDEKARRNKAARINCKSSRVQGNASWSRNCKFDIFFFKIVFNRFVLVCKYISFSLTFSDNSNVCINVHLLLWLLTFSRRWTSLTIQLYPFPWAKISNGSFLSFLLL